MIEFELIDDTENIEVGIIKEIDKYPDLKELPSINDVTLIGNKTLNELGIQPEGDYTTNTELNSGLATKVDKVTGKELSTNDYTNEEKQKLSTLENYDDTEVRELIDTKQPRGNYLTEETDPTVPSHVKSITQEDINNWNNPLFTGDYEELSNLPQINNVELIGNKSLSFLGIQPAGNYLTEEIDPTVPNYVKSITQNDIINWNNKADESDIPDLSGYQTKITSSNKISADLISDGTTNKIVTSTEKNTWNNKQNSISDLSTIRSGASAGATAVQPSDLSTVATTGSYDDLSDIPTNVSEFTNDAGYLTTHQDISGKEDESNKVTSISENSTDRQYPSAKCVYDMIGDVESILIRLTTGGGVS